MEKKYMLTDETKIVEEKTLYRIKALKNFNDVKAGDLGGFIEKEENLSQEGKAWVYNNACVYENARVYGNALICGNALVCGNAHIWEDALIGDDAWVNSNALIHGYAQIYDKAQIRGDAHIFGNTQVYDKARVYENAQIFGDTEVYGCARIYENAQILGKACVHANALVYGNAVISQEQCVSYGVVETDLSKVENLASSIKAQCNLPVIDNKVIAYKLVRPDLTSFYDEAFQYEVGKKVEVKDCDEDNKSCASGLHFSNLTYWEGVQRGNKYVYLEAEIDLNDIITVQKGKIRCRKAKILRSFSI